MENGPSPPEAAGSAEPPDDSGDGDGPHFTQTDPSGRFGRVRPRGGRGRGCRGDSHPAPRPNAGRPCLVITPGR